MRHISRYISSELTSIYNQSKKLAEIAQILKLCLPENLEKNCQIGSFVKGSLILVVEDAVWATQIRYFLPEIRDKLRGNAKLYQLSSIKIIIDPNLYTKNLTTTTTIKKPKKSDQSPWEEILKLLKT